LFLTKKKRNPKSLQKEGVAEEEKAAGKKASYCVSRKKTSSRTRLREKTEEKGIVAKLPKGVVCRAKKGATSPDKEREKKMERKRGAEREKET